MIIHVEFYKNDEGRLCSWCATPPHRRSFEALDAMYGQWLGVHPGARLALEWPVTPLPGSTARSKPQRV